MIAKKIVLPFLVCLTFQISAQSSWTDLLTPKAESSLSTYAAILIEGMPLWDGVSSESPLKVSQLRGMLTVGAVDRKTNQPIEGKDLGFMIGLKDHETNTIWMFSEKVLYKFDLEEIQEKLDYGDQLLIMTVDRSYRLPRHELVHDPGC